MSLAPALLTQHAAQRLMGSLAGRRSGGVGGWEVAGGGGVCTDPAVRRKGIL